MECNLPDRIIKEVTFFAKKHSVMKVVLDTLVLLIRDSFIPDFAVLEKTLKEKLEEAESDWA